MPIRYSRSSRVRSIFRATTRSMMLPTVAHAMWSRFFTAVLFISRATPGHEVLEVAGEARVVLGPGHRLGHDAVLGADESAQHRADDDAPPAEREVAPL